MITSPLTIPQGQSFEAAILVVKSSSFQINKAENFSLNLGSETPAVNTRSTNQLNCSFYFWPNEESYTQGLMPYTLSNSQIGMGENFSTNNLDQSYLGLSAEDAAYKYLQEGILNV